MLISKSSHPPKAGLTERPAMMVLANFLPGRVPCDRLFFLAEEKGGDGGERREKKAAWPAARKNVCTLVSPLPPFPLSPALSERGEAECLRTHVRTHTRTLIQRLAGRSAMGGGMRCLAIRPRPPHIHWSLSWSFML